MKVIDGGRCCCDGAGAPMSNYGNDCRYYYLHGSGWRPAGTVGGVAIGTGAAAAAGSGAHGAGAVEKEMMCKLVGGSLFLIYIKFVASS